MSPLPVLMITISFFLPDRSEGPIPHQLQTIWFPVHVSAALLGNAFMGLAFVIGIGYLVQERQVKGKHMGAIFSRLPPLNVLDEINYRCLTYGFPFMTVGIITGSVWAQNAWGTYWDWSPKETWSLVTWFIYAALLHLRLNVGWRGRRAAILSIIGFTILLFAFIGVTLLGKGSHSFV